MSGDAAHCEMLLGQKLRSEVGAFGSLVTELGEAAGGLGPRGKLSIVVWASWLAAQLE